MNKIPTQENIDTCVESRNKLTKNKHEYKRKIYEFIKMMDGATCDEVEIGLELRHQTASCFIRFLTQDGFLKATSLRRITRAGRKAIVWRVLTEEEKAGKETQLEFV